MESSQLCRRWEQGAARGEAGRPCMYTCVCIYIHTYIHTHIRTYIRTYAARGEARAHALSHRDSTSRSPRGSCCRPRPSRPRAPCTCRAVHMHPSALYILPHAAGTDGVRARCLSHAIRTTRERCGHSRSATGARGCSRVILVSPTERVRRLVLPLPCLRLAQPQVGDLQASALTRLDPQTAGLIRKDRLVCEPRARYACTHTRRVGASRTPSATSAVPPADFEYAMLCYAMLCYAMLWALATKASAVPGCAPRRPAECYSA